MPEAWLNALLGGGLIGLAATILLLVSGRVAGISGIVFGLLRPVAGETLWRFKFVLGLLIGGLIVYQWQPEIFTNTTGRPTLAILAAGLLVGFGTRLGSGCTSGHGVCGISRLSPRSIAATLTFMAAGFVVVALAQKVLGGF